MTLQTRIAVLAVLGMVVTVGTALAFQHIGGYIPCKLCLEQRTPYYVGIPLALAALAASLTRLPPFVARALLAVVALLMTYGLMLAIYHSGVEWNWWAGPTDCAAAGNFSAQDAGSLLDTLSATRPPSCDEAAGRFLGLSFAGWNVLASLALAVLTAYGAFAGAWRARRGV